MRTVKEIKRAMTDQFMSNEEMIESYGLQPNQSFEDQFSVVSIESIWFDIMAIIHFVLEQLFETHKTETYTAIANQKRHKAADVRQRLLDFQLGFPLIPGTDEFFNGSKSEEEIEASKIIKYAAVVESNDEKRVICKIATETNDELSPIAENDLEAVAKYVKEIKPAGVPYTLINYLPDLLVLKIRIVRDPLVLDSNGIHRVDGSEPVKDALKEFMKELPFNGELIIQELANKLEKTEGVKIVSVDYVQTAWINPETGNYNDFEGIDIRKIAESGYFKIDWDNSLNTIDYGTV